LCENLREGERERARGRKMFKSETNRVRVCMRVCPCVCAHVCVKELCVIDCGERKSDFIVCEIKKGVNVCVCVCVCGFLFGCMCVLVRGRVIVVCVCVCVCVRERERERLYVWPWGDVGKLCESMCV